MPRAQINWRSRCERLLAATRAVLAAEAPTMRNLQIGRAHYIKTAKRQGDKA
jgi:hypothetical protein